MMIDTMAKRYALLPSEILDRASTVDLYVLSNALSYTARQSETRVNSKAPPIPKLTQEQMRAMIDKVKKTTK